MPNAILPPFSAIPLPGYMRKEFKRRSDSYGNQYTGDFANVSKYTGSMSPWVRVVSNAKKGSREGFIMHGGEGFKDAYGIKNKIDLNGFNQTNATVIGFDRLGEPHVIKNVFDIQKFRPTPGIEGFEIDIRKDVYRAAFIKWKCYTVSQLNYMTPYMFSPYTTVLLEWGWNNYNPTSLLDVTDLGEEAHYLSGSIETSRSGSGLRGAYTNPELMEERLRKSEGKYDGMIGHIINFNYSYNASEQCFNCTTEIASNSRFYFGLSYDKIVSSQKPDSQSEASKRTAEDTFAEDLYSILENFCQREYIKSTNLKKLMSTTKFETKVDLEKASQYGKLADVYKILTDKSRNGWGLFSPAYYNQYVLRGGESTTKYKGKLYISIGLLIDLINLVSAKAMDNCKINISNTIIGAHPNLILNTEEILIPNALAPYFSPESLATREIRPHIPQGSKSESPLFESVSLNDKQSKYLSNADNILKKVFFTSGKLRQDLNNPINYLRHLNTGNPGAYSFPSTSDVFSGKLEDIYIDYESVKNLVKSRSSKEFLLSLCELINNKIPIIKLEIVDISNNFISIRDSRYINLEHTNKLKAQLGVEATDELVYKFDVYAQNSVTTEFSFNVKLSDSVANMILYQVNSDLSDNTDPTKVDTNKNFLLPSVKDYLLAGLKYPEDTTQTPPPPDPSESLKNKGEAETFIKNIAADTLCFEQMVGDKKKVVRLNLPKSENARVIQLLNDENVDFFNISTMPIPGVTVEFTFLGIAGFRTFQIFSVKDLPAPYSEGALFQVIEIKHSVGPGGWTTRVVAAVRPSKSIEDILV